MTERWKPVRDFPGYLVSDQGRVFTQKMNRLMVPHKRDSPGSKTGRPQLTAVCLTHDRKKHTMYVHRLVADAFICELTPADAVMHHNGDDTDNRLENLYIKGLEFYSNQPKKKEENQWKSPTNRSLMTWITSAATSGS